MMGRVTIGLVAVAFAACAADRPPAGDFHGSAPPAVIVETDAGGVFQTGPCTTENAHASCHLLTNPQTGECTPGLQDCRGGQWTTCDISGYDGGGFVFVDGAVVAIDP